MKQNEYEIVLAHFAQNDKVIYRIMNTYCKFNLQPQKNYFVTLLNTIISQQLSVNSANAIIERFFEKFSKNPDIEEILNARESDLRVIGLSFAKIKYVKDLCFKISTKEFNLKNISKKSDEKIISELTKVKGIGIWTAHIFLIFNLARKNVLPYSDLVLKKSIMLNYDLDLLPDEEMVKEISIKNNWDPYNSYAAWYLWKSLDK